MGTTDYTVRTAAWFLNGTFVFSVFIRFIYTNFKSLQNFSTACDSEKQVVEKSFF